MNTLRSHRLQTSGAWAAADETPDAWFKITNIDSPRIIVAVPADHVERVIGSIISVNLFSFLTSSLNSPFSSLVCKFSGHRISRSEYGLDSMSWPNSFR